MSSQSRRYSSPLRYPGGKGKISNYMKILFLENHMDGWHYVEPYAGGASVALSLLFEEYVSKIHINDINRGLYSFWYAVINRTEELCQRIVETEVSVVEWRRQREVQAATDPDVVDLAFSTFFLNRTSRSGIIGGGVIGGKNQQGKWKIDARYNKSALIDRIKKISRYKGRISLTRMDAVCFLDTVVSKLPEKTFLYLDPPYYIKGRGLYENFYSHEDHELVFQAVANLTKPWIVSYDAVPEIFDLYSEYRHIIYGLSYSAASRYKGSEVMYFSPELSPPAIDSPANIYADQVSRFRMSGQLSDQEELGESSWLKPQVEQARRAAVRDE